MTRTQFVTFALLFILLLSGCSSTAAPTATIAPTTMALSPTSTTADQPAVSENTPTNAPTAAPVYPPPQPTAVPAYPAPGQPVAAPAYPPPGQPASGQPALAADPQRIEFQAEDGAQLVGYYYPAAINPAPLVVLMHWAGGDQTDWQYVGLVTWLQNRGTQVPAAPGTMNFDTPYPFPPLPEGVSYAVFTFDFRGYGESAPASTPQSQLVLDAQAAYTTAAALPGVDPAKVVGIGASLGADAVVDGCNEACMAALSLSPGGYLKVAYAGAAKMLDDQGKPVWCVAAQDDQPAIQACQAASGEHYQSQIYPSGGHAMHLFRVENNLQPPIESVILDYLKLVFGTP